jgi:hypothetical protein
MDGQMRRFRREYGDDPRIVIPMVFDEYTTKRVLVMEYADSLTRSVEVGSGFTSNQKGELNKGMLVSCWSF